MAECGLGACTGPDRSLSRTLVARWVVGRGGVRAGAWDGENQARRAVRERRLWLGAAQPVPQRG